MRNVQRPFIILSGLPGSGKSTLGKQLAAAFNLPYIDKDDILEKLFESLGVGDSTWRRQLSRKSDVMFRQESMASEGAVLVSWWHLSGMNPQSGTPTDWLHTLSNRVVHVRCACKVEIAARRVIDRVRHPGHLDSAKTYSDEVTGLQRLSRLPRLDIGLSVTVDTSHDVHLDAVVNEVQTAFASL